MNGLTNKSILIVGGGSGIGLATALRAAASGATPIIAGRSREKLDAALAKLPNSARAEVLDFADAASVTSLVERIGPIDHLVLSASSAVAWGGFADLKEEGGPHRVRKQILGLLARDKGARAKASRRWRHRNGHGSGWTSGPTRHVGVGGGKRSHCCRGTGAGGRTRAPTS